MYVIPRVARAPPRLWPQHSTRVGILPPDSCSITLDMFFSGTSGRHTPANCCKKPAAHMRHVTQCAQQVAVRLTCCQSLGLLLKQKKGKQAGRCTDNNTDTPQTGGYMEARTDDCFFFLPGLLHVITPGLLVRETWADGTAGTYKSRCPLTGSNLSLSRSCWQPSGKPCILGLSRLN